MDQNGILFFYPGALYVAGTRMQIHGLPQFPANDSTFAGGTMMQMNGLPEAHANDSTFAGGTMMQMNGLPEARANDSTQSVKECHRYHCPGSCTGARCSL